MGRKDPDRACLPPEPALALTIGQMRRLGWTLRAACPRCDVNLIVDSAALVRLLGADALFWGRHPRCRVWRPFGAAGRCPGRVTFHARSSPTGSWRALTMSADVRLAQQFIRQVRQDLSRERRPAAAAAPEPSPHPRRPAR